MRLFFDNNTSPTLADTIGGYVGHLGHTAHHIRTLECGPHAKDVEWIAMLAAAPARDWIVFTGDLRISRNKAERVAYAQARLFGFALAPGFLKGMAQNQIAAALLIRWPEIELLISLLTTGLYEIPVKGRFRPLL